MNFQTKLKLVLTTLLLTATLPAAAAPEGRHSIWRVQSDDGTLYLAGSLHLLKPSDHPPPPIFDHVLDRADALALEVDLGEAESLAAQLAILARGVFPDGRSLDDVLAPDALEALKRELADLHIEYATVQYFKPWLLLLTLTHARLSALGFDPELGVDSHLYQAAQKRGMPVHGLETLDFQIDLFDKTLAGRDDELVRHTLAEFETLEGAIDQIVAAWHTGDIDTLGAILLESFESFPELAAALVTDRNRNWMPRLTDWLAGDETVLVVVGAGHLPGPEGLIALLAADGYRIEQLQTDRNAP